MPNKLAVLLMMILLCGCSDAPKPVAPKPTTPSGNQWSDAVTNDSPYINFIKKWHMQMTPEISLQVDAEYKPWLDTDCAEWCVFTFTMQQGDDAKKWVVFDCDEVAEKIVQSQLVPIATQDCKLLREEAIQYWKDHPDPDEYTDNAGRVWKEQPNAK